MYFDPAAVIILCCGRFLPASTAAAIGAWCLRPVGVLYASDYFRGRPHRQLVEEPKLHGLGELCLHHLQERQNH